MCWGLVVTVLSMRFRELQKRPERDVTRVFQSSSALERERERERRRKKG